MRTKYLFINICLAALALASCTKDDLQDKTASYSNGIKQITATVADYGAATRSELYQARDEIKFRWSAGDVLGIFPDEGDQVGFAIDDSKAGALTATFDGGGWALKPSHKYAVYFPYIEDAYLLKNAIPLDYTGQVQRNGSNLTHLSKYDFLASNTTSPVDGNLQFTMNHVGAILLLRIHSHDYSFFTKCELVADENVFTTKATLSIAGDTPATTSVEKSNVLTLQMENVSDAAGIGMITCAMMVYPVNLEDKHLKVNLYKSDGTCLSGEVENPQNLEAGKPYAFNVTISKKLTNANLIAAAEQQSGSTFVKNADGSVNIIEATNKAIISSITELDLSRKNDETICDEIGFFTSLKSLKCDFNGINSLDVSMLPDLQTLFCSYNNISTLDITSNVNLTLLSCDYNKLQTLDVSKQPTLYILDAAGNKLSSIDVSQNTKLSHLNIYGNELTTLDISHNPRLTTLYCNHNKLTSLDLSNNTDLQYYISFCNNRLTQVDISNTQAALSGIYAGSQTNEYGEDIEVILYVNNGQKNQSFPDDYGFNANNPSANDYFNNKNVRVVLASEKDIINPNPDVPNPGIIN